MGLLLLGLLGSAALGAVALDWFGEGEENQSDGSPNGAGQELNFDGSNVLNGTEGDDTIPPGQDGFLTPEEINLFGGDDVVTIDAYHALTIFGGDGNDLITSNGAASVVEGGAGNDTLTTDDGNEIFGGVGDDVLNFTHGSYDIGDPGVVNGGEGDDTINMRADALITQEHLTNVGGGIDILGGDGADDINIVYDFFELEENRTPADSGKISHGFLRLLDFNPGEDSLVIEFERDSQTADRTITIDLNQTEDNGTYTSLITFTFEATVDEDEAVNFLTVTSSAPFTLDDIQFVGV